TRLGERLVVADQRGPIGELAVVAGLEAQYGPRSGDARRRGRGRTARGRRGAAGTLRRQWRGAQHRAHEGPETAETHLEPTARGGSVPVPSQCPNHVRM